MDTKRLKELAGIKEEILKEDHSTEIKQHTQFIETAIDNLASHIVSKSWYELLDKVEKSHSGASIDEILEAATNNLENLFNSMLIDKIIKPLNDELKDAIKGEAKVVIRKNRSAQRRR